MAEIRKRKKAKKGKTRGISAKMAENTEQKYSVTSQKALYAQNATNDEHTDV